MKTCSNSPFSYPGAGSKQLSLARLNIYWILSAQVQMQQAATAESRDTHASHTRCDVCSRACDCKLSGSGRVSTISPPPLPHPPNRGVSSPPSNLPTYLGLDWVRLSNLRRQRGVSYLTSRPRVSTLPTTPWTGHMVVPSLVVTYGW